MEPPKPNRNAELRAAIASAVVGVWMLVQGILSYQEGLGAAAWVFLAIAFLFLGLAVPVYRGSDDAALAVAGIFALLLVFALFAGGLRGLFPWPAIMTVVMAVGMYGVLVQGRSYPARGARRR